MPNQNKPTMLNKDNRLDKTGLFASSLCLLHCAALSVFLPLFSLNLPFIADERLAQSFLFVSVLMGLAAFVPTLKMKGRAGIGLLGLTGLCGLVVLEVFLEGIASETVRFFLSLPFFAMLFRAHWKNIRVCKACASKSVLQKLSLFSPV